MGNWMQLQRLNAALHGERVMHVGVTPETAQLTLSDGTVFELRPCAPWRLLLTQEQPELSVKVVRSVLSYVTGTPDLLDCTLFVGYTSCADQRLAVFRGGAAMTDVFTFRQLV